MFPLLAIAQNKIELPSSYFLERTSQRTEPCLIKKLINYNMYLSANHDSIKQFNTDIQLEYYKKITESETVNLNIGNYHFQNKDVDFIFSINENGLLNGEAKFYKLKSPDYQSAFTFLNGILIKTKTIVNSKNQIYSQTELKDSILTEELFYPSGKLREKTTEDFKIREYKKNTITIKYYENGITESYYNSLEGIEKYFNSKGKLTKHIDDKNGFGKYYDDNGIIDNQYYKKGNECCKESYSNGVISSKKCRNDRESREYFYEKGKMTHYEIYNLTTRESRVFDSKNKLMQGKSIPRISIPN